MSPAFRAALQKTLGYEGGLVAHPADRGGRTNYGITQRTYDAYRRTTGQGLRPVDLIEEAEVQRIYHDDYWQPCHCDALPQRLAECVFDMAVNSGVSNAVITLQRAARVRVDSYIGPVTIAASQQVSALEFLRKRAAFIQDVVAAKPSQVVFLEGWINRLLDQAWRPT